MSKDAIIIVLGLVVAATPFLGFPSSWEMGMLIIVGLAIAALAFLLRRDVLRRGGYRPRQAAHDVYVENGADTEIKPAHDMRPGTHEKETS